MTMMMFCRQVKNLPADDQRQPPQRKATTATVLQIQKGDGGEKATNTTITTTNNSNNTQPTSATRTTLAVTATAARSFMPRRSSDENSLTEKNNAEIVWNSMTNQHNSQNNTSRNNVNINRNNDDVDDEDNHNQQQQQQHHDLHRHHHLSNDHQFHCKLFVNSLSLHLDEYIKRRRGKSSELHIQPIKQIYFKRNHQDEVEKENEDCIVLQQHKAQHYHHHHHYNCHQSEATETRFQRRPLANTTPLVRYALTVLICLMLVISAETAAQQQRQQQPQQSISFSSSTSALYPFVPSNPGRHVYTSAFPRRRTADGTGLMQSRAVDTRVQFEVLEGQPKGTVVGYIPTRPDFTYRFNEPPREFNLDPVTGEIKTNMVLDREGMRERYDLVVLSSQPTYPIEVRITVLDVNDNAPEFPEPSIAVSFSESAAKGTRCLLDAATDLDIGINGISNNYTIVEGNVDNKFRLAVTSNPSGDVSYLHLETTGDLDRETRAFYRLNISAKDGGSPPKYGYLQVNVSIIDVNDNPPVFDHSDYTVSLNESIPPGSSVLQVMASDKDLGDNSKITYYLADTETQFTVDPETGVISTTEHLNCPQQNCPTFSRPGVSCPKSCVFTVFARDHGSPRQDGRAYVTVNLVDTNDHDPVIRFQYFPPTGSFATVDENAINGSVVAAVSVVDMDEGLNGETSIKITSGNELGHFRLEKTPSFDIVRVNGVLDREEIGKYNLTVVATDKGTPSRTATSYLIIHVNDVNDHEPVFEKSEYSAVLSELAPPGSFVASITATDEDTGVNALIFYDFVSGNNNQWFAIDSSTGLITTQAPLDREIEGSVELSISARDGGPNPKWAYTQLKVTILDENDEAPQFTQSQINVTLSEATPPHTLIAMLTANDHDQGTNGSVTYSLAMVSERKYPEQFQLDSLTGQLTTRKSLDRELQQNYEILVIARDQGTPPKSSTATVNLHIEDVNDNAPQFYPKKYFHALAIPMQQHQGNSNNNHNNAGTLTTTGGGGTGDIDIMSLLQKPLLKVFATDRDEGDNALITYTLNTGGDGLFVVDTWSGSIMLSSKVVATTTASTTGTEILQHFTKPLYKLHITAKDRGERHSEQDAVVEIMMQHKMESLDFDSYSQTYEFQITEDHAMEQAHLGREVGQVQIKQQHTNSPDMLEYAIVYGDPEENFSINKKTGVISTAKPIDREISNQYQLEVVARRGLAYGKCLVHISVQDLNDNKPVFALERDDEVLLPENSAVGQEVYIARARDRDSGNNSRITYTLTFNPDMLFRIGASTGVIYLQKPIKAEPNSNIQIELTATDHGKPALSSKHIITVVVTDVNDHTPVFDYTSYETSLLESTPVNDRFFSVAAHDKDLDLNGRLSYEILEGNVAQKFGIFPDGFLFVRSSLDREERDYYALTVKCHDQGEPQRSSEVPVIIHIIDENDNAPQFTNSSFTFSLPENEPADAFVGKLTASDRDIGRNAELIYTLASPGKDFIIDSRNGFIKTLHPFDREELIQRMPSSSSLTGLAGAHNYILLEAIVADNGNPRLKDKVKIKIIITDVNDNAPEFVRAPYKVQISEGSLVGTQLMRVYTNDLDEGLNGDVYYSIINGNQEGRFQIDDATGQLSLSRKLDREYQAEYKLKVMAKDAAIEGQQLNSTTFITIEVLDENDMAPKFVETITEITVLETTAISTELMRFKAVDLDLGINSQISFTITAGNRKDTFHIDSYTGILYLHKVLDYEETTVYNLNITASDGGSPRLSSTIVFTVHVKDENDNPPTFPNTAIVRQIKEGIDLKTPIVTVTAEDPDSGPNGKVTYSIVKQEPELAGGRHFGINTQTGVIHTLREIDRETIDTFRLTVVATDQAKKPEMQQSAEKLVTVIVEDINDNAPVFISMNAAILPSKNVQMYSQSRDGALIMYVHATDADSSSNGIVTYELVSGNMDLFKLQRNTGAITLRKPINRPEVRYQLSLKATDEAVQSERKSSDAYITIISTSAAGVPGPVFDQREQSGSVYENEPIGTSILTVSARLNTAEIEYYVTNVTAVGSAGSLSVSSGKYKNVERLFDIDTKLGILSTAKELDREAGADTYEIEVYAIALGGSPRTTSTKLKVMILDKNDSPPVFRDLPLSFNVSEDLTAGHLIATIRASDPDTLGSLTFSLVNGDDSKFFLERDTGKLRLKEALDRELKENYQLKIRVSDGVQHTETIVEITVTDTNDNPPQFDVPVYSFDIPENAPRGYQVGIIAATDPDLGNNAVVTYTVISDWANDVFSLNPQTGVLTLTARLDYEDIQHYILVVQAQDNGQPSLSTTLTVYCNVLDLNDNPPVFDPISYSMEIYENVSIGTPVVTVMATDIDSGDNGRIEYTITSGDDNNDFEIFSNGTIRTQRTLDRETKSSYNLIVTARDCAKEFPMMYDEHNDHDGIDDDDDDNNEVRVNQYPSMPYNLQRQRRQYLQYQQQLQLQQLQHQQQQQYGGVVQEPQQRLSATVQVTIILKDVNDEAPIFLSSNVTEVLENIPLNTVVMVVKAVDRDEGKNGYIEYILKGENSLPFTLGPVDGLLRVSGKLDREMKNSYMLNITAKDRGEPEKSTQSQIHVKILDENDNAPIFDPKQYTASVAENASIGAMVLQVSATDVDEGANGRVRFAIVGGDNNRDFMISEDSGIVRVSKNLNYERKSRYVLTVKAEDSAADLGLAYDNEKGRNKLSHLFENRYDLAEITIVITDINDNPPTFLDSPYLAYVMENVIPPNGGYVLTVQAYDADTPPFNSLVRYFLKEGDTDLFRINASTGEISLLRSLDREAKAEYTLTLVAMDTGSPPLTGTGIVKVIVQDMNDHSPEFERQSYHATVHENQAIGTKVIQPIANDKDAGLNAKIRFTLLGEKLERFHCNAETGEITTAAILDREETAVYFLTLMAQDSSATEPRATAVNLTISVQDVNDNMPRFEANQYHINIPDKTGQNEFVFGAWARDNDEGLNALVMYNISGKDVEYFTINAKTGVIKTKRNLGSDLNRQYSLVIHAFDQGIPSKSSQSDLMISMKPSSSFPSFNYMANTQFMLSEDVAPGKKITTITASSPKKGSAGNIKYSIAGGNLGEAVRIDSTTGVVTIGKDGLDYEMSSQYEIWLEALDSDRLPLRSVMLLTINVTDANDNAPVMEKLIYNAEVMEEESPPQTIFKVKANDRDSGDNGEVTYRLLDDFEGTFEIDADSGEIYTTMRLDREEMSHYELTVEAVDQGMPQLTGSATVLLNLLDKNDNPPKFTRLFSVNVTENAEIGSFVIQVTSMDLDEGPNANAIYTLTENPGEKFKLDSISGNITVDGHIDREEQDEYILKITASDGAWRSDTPITITIQDQNDNAPEFERGFYSFNFPELQRAVAFVGQVVANDRDKHGPNSVISFSLQHPSDIFTIDPATGEIFSKKSIKYKHSQYEASPENVYTLTVIATDNGKPPLYSECMININIVDANNHAPKFEKSLYLSPVPEHARVGQRVVRVQAHDSLDTGVNAEVEYSFKQGNGTEFFSISHQDGWISLSKVLEVTPNTLFYLNVKASDHGVPSKSDETRVHIIVTGENRYSPEFTVLSYQVIVPENEPVGSTILTVSASDRDEGLNGMLRYAIAGGNERPEFKVDAETGAVIILQPLDYDSIQEYHLNISVQDLGFKPKTAVAQLTVILTDINDNPPLFNQSEYHAFISENKPAHSYVFRAQAKDKDSPKNSIIRYSITSGSGKNFFAINANTGVITSSVSFDYEERNEYTLQVMAANPDSHMHSMCQIIVHIRGVNEFYPQFVQPVFHFDVSESAEVGTPVGSIQATDKDAGEDGNVYYLLVGSSNDKGFSINPSTGFIYVSRHLDRETQSRAVLTVMAKNYGSIRGNDTDEAQVIISIQDGNDPPEFLKSLYMAKISEAATVGSKVVNVKAVDKDVRPQNNQFSYSIINGNINQTFKVDPQTGEIATSKKLDREQVPEYNLVVGAIDTGLPPQTGTTMVRIELLDVNDNGPTFSNDGLIGYISENEPAGTSIMTLSATDPDLPPNGGPFMYYLIGGKHKAFITIDKHSGLVKSTRSFDREQTPELEAIIEVEDNGQPKQKAQHKLIIKVLDQNDSPSSTRTVHVLLNVFNDNMPIGKIADVHPNDADVTGNYRCRIIPSSQSSPMGLLIIPNACDLHTTYQTSVNNGYSYSISGNDGKHGDVVSTVTVGFQNFDNSTIANSITVLIRNMTAENFLASYYRNFVDLMKSAVDSSENLLVYSVRNTTYNSTDLEVMIALKMANQGYRLPHYLVDRLSKKREAVTRLLKTATNVVIGYDPCSLSQACDNGGLCTSERRLHDSETLNIVDSESLIFSGPLVTHDFICKCPDGFMGQQCDKRQDPCAPNPCHGNAQCRRLGYDFQCNCPANREGKYCQQERGDVCSGNPCSNGGSCRSSPDGSSFFCLCRPGYRGNQCEHVADSCRPNPCLHGGVCVAIKPGYKCTCSEGRYGRHCEKTTFGFGDLSFMTFPPLDAATNDISVVFATTKPDALLMYNYGIQSGGRSDFVAIEVVRGKAFFSFGGARTAITTVVVGGSNNLNLADGNWHKVTATRNGRVMSLSVANCVENGDVCEECRPGDTTCYADDVGPIGTLNFNKQPLLLGGLISADPVLERPGQLHTDDLVGCVHSVSVNGRALNLSQPLKQRSISITCNRNLNGGPCIQSTNTDLTANLCGPFGSCMDRWDTAMCQCGGSLLSPDCQNSLEPISITDGAFIEFKITEKHRRMQLLDNLYAGNSIWSYDISRQRRFTIDHDNLTALAQTNELPKTLSLIFRTYKENGLLLFAASNNHYTSLELQNGKMVYYSNQDSIVNMTISNPAKLNDGKWHNITLHSVNRILRIIIDDARAGEELDFAGVHDYLDPYLTVLSVGGVRREYLPQEHMPTNYEGCFANFTINNEIQPFNGSGSVFSEVLSRGKITHGCAGVMGIGAAQVADPISIGVTLVIVFFVILVVAILGSYVIYRFRGKQEKIGSLSCGVPGFKIKHNPPSTMLGGAGVSQNPADHVLSRGMHGNEAQVGYHNDNGDLIRSVPGHHMVGPELISKKFKEREINPGEHQQQRPQRPDIIEREVVSKSPPLRDEHHPPIPPPSQSHHPHDHASSVDMNSEYPEHYDLENASSIAPSDIDIVYHYKGYREAGGVRKYKATPAPVASYTHHKHQSAASQQQHRHSPRHGVGGPFVPRGVPPQANQPPPPSSTPRQHQSTPLARLSPSSELSSQQPRILTLHDISGKPLQSALLATTSSSGGVGKDALHSNSERSLNSPVMSQLSGQSSSASRQKPVVSAQTASQAPMGLTAEEIERLNARPRTSSLVSTLDAVSSSSEAPRGPVGAHHLSLSGGLHSTDVDAHSSTSTDESGNDSFTCSEIEYDNNSINGDAKFSTSKSIPDERNPVGRAMSGDGSRGSAVAKAPPMPPHSFDGFDSSFRGSLSTLVASDDDVSTHMGALYRQVNSAASPTAPPPMGWEYLLNWGPNFESLVGVFKDIAELPDNVGSDQRATGSLRMNQGQNKQSEEYV
ncbi:cadherin-related tumor suppressor isoform X1 [Lucilia cuprina]|uniref:cadherin-related tumor suppressor isoform X1 n=1 Tax=Lucilia cuprina TaxID=7375 RepID=UPI001F070666|nr:cadherin-related tumor suppressor isoform X1 [Lucilia cuprina]